MTLEEAMEILMFIKSQEIEIKGYSSLDDCSNIEKEVIARRLIDEVKTR